MFSQVFYQQILIPLTLMPVVSLIILLTILAKAPLCPGQRGRISSSLFSCWVVLALSVLLSQQAGVHWSSWLLGGLAAVTGIGLSVWEAKLEKPLDDRYYRFPAAFSLIYLVFIGSQIGSGWSWLLGLGGAVAFSHLLLLKARHRLAAFDWILPLAGIVISVFSLCLMVVQLVINPDLVQSQTQILIWIGLLLGATLIWCGPWLLQRTFYPPAVGVATTLMLAANTMSSQLLW